MTKENQKVIDKLKKRVEEIHKLEEHEKTVTLKKFWHNVKTRAKHKLDTASEVLSGLESEIMLEVGTLSLKTKKQRLQAKFEARQSLTMSPEWTACEDAKELVKEINKLSKDYLDEARERKDYESNK